MLPKEKRKPIKDLSRQIIFIYGKPKIGKTTFASHFPGALFLATEEGHKHIEGYIQPINKWTDFLETVGDLERDKGAFETAIIDTVDNLYLFCQDFIYNKFNVTHESDLQYGKGWKIVTAEFRKQITRLSKAGVGLILISHSEEKDVWLKGLTPRTETVCTLTGKVKTLIYGIADVALYMEADDHNRVIHTKPTKDYEAGDRTGLLPDTLPLDYGAFVDAYYGKGAVSDTAREELVTAILSGLKYLADNQIDHFDTPKRVAQSMKNHLGQDHLEGLTIGQLQEYLIHLRAKAKEMKKQPKSKKEESNASNT